MDENIGLVISDGEKCYKILKPIGTWGRDFSLVIYEAAVLEVDGDASKAPLVAFKMIPEMGDLEEYHEVALEDLHKSGAFANDVAASSFILPVTNSFYSEVKGEMTLCIVLPYKPDVVSLRSLISTHSRYHNGIPDAFIKIALARVVQGLDKIHNEKQSHHMQINAGTIFFNHKSETIQLAYGATVYELGGVLNDNNIYSINKMLAWGLAPEVKGADEPLKFADAYDTAKSDIWLVGIAALELAYGKIPVESRRELLQIADYICEAKTLPNTWEELRHKSAELAADKASPYKKRKFRDEEAILGSLATGARGRLSDCFAKFLAMCLDADVKKRASVMELGNHAFLNENVGTMKRFRDVVVKGLSPYFLRVVGPKKAK